MTAQTINYLPGNAGYTLTPEQSDQLSKDLKSAQDTFTNAPSTLSLGKDIYNDLSAWLSAAQASGAIVDQGVLNWLQGAAEVNTGTGFYSDLITTYSDDEHRIRDGIGAANLQQASNLIAISLAQTILNQKGVIPNIIGLGADDAGSVASTVFTESDAPGGVFSPWAGTELFPFLGGGEFYQDWILNMNTVAGTITDPTTGGPKFVNFKTVDGTYDLISSIEAYQQTATYLSPNYRIQSLSNLFNNPDETSYSTSATNFFYNVYGLTNTQAPAIGKYTAFSEPITTLLNAVVRLFADGPTFIAGTLGDDTIVTQLGVNIVNTGPGNDVIIDRVGSSGNIMDGGDGVNTANYSQSNTMVFKLENQDLSDFQYRFEALSQSGGKSDFLYDIQNIIGSSFGSTLDIASLSSDFWAELSQPLSIDLGSSVALNQVIIDGSQSATANYFSISGDAVAHDWRVAAVSGGLPVPTGDGVNVLDVGQVIIKGGTVQDNVDISGGAISPGNVKYVGNSGSANINASNMNAGGIVEVLAGAGAENIIMGPDTTLKIDNSSVFVGTIRGVSQGDKIDLLGIGIATGATLGANNVLTVAGSAGAITLNLDPNQNFKGYEFST